MPGANGDSERYRFPLLMELQRERHEPGRTFSEEALDEFGRAFVLAIAEHVGAVWEASGRPPERLEVRAHLELWVASE